MELYVSSFVENHNSTKRDHTLTLLASRAWTESAENNERPDAALQSLWPQTDGPGNSLH